MMMTDARVMSIDELKAFLASSDMFTFKTLGKEPMVGSSVPYAPTATAFGPDHRKE